MSSRPNNAAATPAAGDSNAPEALTVRPKTLGKVVSHSVLTQIKRASRIGRELSGVSQRQLALSLETKRVTVAHFELEHQPRVPNAEHLSNVNAPREWVRSMVGVITDTHRMQVIDRASVVHGDNHFARLAALTTELTDVLRVKTHALSDGHLSDAQIVDVRKEIQEAISALLEADAYFVGEQAKRRAERAR